jgi:diketogulonate reductase-like aldo/keto reductase
MLPLTGTSDEAHMRQDLDCMRVRMTEDEVREIETLSASSNK